MVIYSIIKKSQLEGALRLDAEFFYPEKLKALAILEKLSGKRMGDYFINSKGLFNPISQKLNGKTIVYDLSDALSLFLGDGMVIDSEKDIGSVKKILNKNDVIISRLRSYLKEIAFVFDNDKLKLASSEFVVLRTKQKEICPEALFAFLQTDIVQKILEWSQEGVNHPRFSEEVLLDIKYPDILIKNQDTIKSKIVNANNLYLNSNSLYQQAENLLLEELGLKNFSFDENLSSVVNFSDIKSANRMDAEYFQNRYEKLIEKIKDNSRRLEIFIEDYSTGFPYKSENYQETGTPLIRINNIKKGILDLSDTAYLSEKDCKISPKDEAKSGDIVLSMSGTIGASAIIPDDMPKSYVNQRILKFTSKNIDKNYLTLLLNSIVGSYQLERIGTGGVQTNISYKDIKNILIPILPIKIQQKIADLVRKSHEARKKAKELLEEAKQKVEELIENK